MSTSVGSVDLSILQKKTTDQRTTYNRFGYLGHKISSVDLSTCQQTVDLSICWLFQLTKKKKIDISTDKHQQIVKIWDTLMLVGEAPGISHGCLQEKNQFKLCSANLLWQCSFWLVVEHICGMVPLLVVLGASNNWEKFGDRVLRTFWELFENFLRTFTNFYRGNCWFGVNYTALQWVCTISFFRRLN